MRARAWEPVVELLLMRTEKNMIPPAWMSCATSESRSPSPSVSRRMARFTSGLASAVSVSTARRSGALKSVWPMESMEAMKSFSSCFPVLSIYSRSVLSSTVEAKDTAWRRLSSPTASTNCEAASVRGAS